MPRVVFDITPADGQQMNRSNDPETTRDLDAAAPAQAMASRRERLTGEATGVGSVGFDETGAFDVGAGGREPQDEAVTRDPPRPAEIRPPELRTSSPVVASPQPMETTMAEPPRETPTFQTDEVQANRAMEQGLGVGARELAAQRDPGGVNTADEDSDLEKGVSVEAGDEDQLDENVIVQGLDNAG